MAHVGSAKGARSLCSPDVETVKRRGLKIPHPGGFVGSIPTPGTTFRVVDAKPFIARFMASGRWFSLCSTHPTMAMEGAASRVGGEVCNNARDRTPRARRMSCYLLYVAGLALTLFSAWMSLRSPHWYWPLGIFGALSLLGTWDMLQTRTTLRSEEHTSELQSLMR